MTCDIDLYLKISPTVAYRPISTQMSSPIANESNFNTTRR